MAIDTSTTRRSVFAGAALATSLITTAVASADLDAELVAACRKLIETEKTYDDCVREQEDHPALSALADLASELECQIADLPARSRTGLLAKARIVKDIHRRGCQPDAAIVHSLCEDLLLMSPPTA